jgi:uncharacterized protein (TIGR00661 family)
VAEALQKRGAKVLLGSYGYVRRRCEEEGYSTVGVPREIEMWGEGGSFNMSQSIRKSLRPALAFPKTIGLEKKTLQRFKAHCVVADGRGAVVFAAKALGIPVVIITNQTTLQPFFNRTFHKLPGVIAEKVMWKTLEYSAAILIPDLPPPHTVCKYTLSSDERITPKQIFTGPMVLKKQTPPARLSKPTVLVLLGGHSYRKPIFDAIVQTAKDMRDVHFVISSKFTTTENLSNLEAKHFLPDITSYLQASDLVITQAGHNTAMELLTYAKPSILVPDSGQIEQESNARAMRELDVSETQTYERLNPARIKAMITTILNNQDYAERAKKLSTQCVNLKGSERAAEIIMDTVTFT